MTFAEITSRERFEKRLNEMSLDQLRRLIEMLDENLETFPSFRIETQARLALAVNRAHALTEGK